MKKKKAKKVSVKMGKTPKKVNFTKVSKADGKNKDHKPKSDKLSKEKNKLHGVDFDTAIKKLFTPKIPKTPKK